jgi:hypothetical protein
MHTTSEYIRPSFPPSEHRERCGGDLLVALGDTVLLDFSVQCFRCGNTWMANIVIDYPNDCTVIESAEECWHNPPVTWVRRCVKCGREMGKVKLSIRNGELWCRGCINGMARKGKTLKSSQRNKQE